MQDIVLDIGESFSVVVPANCVHYNLLSWLDIVRLLSLLLFIVETFVPGPKIHLVGCSQITQLLGKVHPLIEAGDIFNNLPVAPILSRWGLPHGRFVVVIYMPSLP